MAFSVLRASQAPDLLAHRDTPLFHLDRRRPALPDLLLHFRRGIHGHLDLELPQLLIALRELLADHQVHVPSSLLLSSCS